MRLCLQCDVEIDDSPYVSCASIPGNIIPRSMLGRACFVNLIARPFRAMPKIDQVLCSEMDKVGMV